MDGGHGDSSSDALDSGGTGYPSQRKMNLSHLTPEQLKAYEAREDKKHNAFLLIGSVVVASLWAHHLMTTYSVDSAKDVQSCITRTYEDNFGPKATEDFAEREECNDITRYVVGNMTNPPGFENSKLSQTDKAQVMDKIGKLREKATHVLESGHKEVWAKP